MVNYSGNSNSLFTKKWRMCPSCGWWVIGHYGGMIFSVCFLHEYVCDCSWNQLWYFTGLNLFCCRVRWLKVALFSKEYWYPENFMQRQYRNAESRGYKRWMWKLFLWIQNAPGRFQVFLGGGDQRDEICRVILKCYLPRVSGFKYENLPILDHFKPYIHIKTAPMRTPAKSA